MAELKNRTEMLFLYDIENANPNGDPNDENKPRLDEETGKNIVTDVRLKRTIRDYLLERGHEILVQEKIYNDEGHIQDAKLRAENFLIDKDGNQITKKDVKKLIDEKEKNPKKTDYLNKMIDLIKIQLFNCIDLRLFGATLPVEWEKKPTPIASSITFTGPVQFKMGKSLHAVKLNYVKGTGAFASKQGVTRKTFREEYMLPYSLIGFYGIINENAGKHTQLTKKDITLLKEAMWNGTKGLISRSKFGQIPRLLLSIQYKDPGFFIGELDNLVCLRHEMPDTRIRRPEDYTIDLSELMGRIEKAKNKIQSISFIADEKLRFLSNGEPVKLTDLDGFTDESAEVL